MLGMWPGVSLGLIIMAQWNENGNPFLYNFDFQDPFWICSINQILIEQFVIVFVFIHLKSPRCILHVFISR